MQKQRTIADQVNTWLGAGLSLLFALLGWGAMSLADRTPDRERGLRRSCSSAGRPVPYRFGWDRAIARRLLRLRAAARGVQHRGVRLGLRRPDDRRLDARRAGPGLLRARLQPRELARLDLLPAAASGGARGVLRPQAGARSGCRATSPGSWPSSRASPSRRAWRSAAPRHPSSSSSTAPQWLPAADVLLWMAAVAALKIWFELAYDYLVVQGKSGVVLLIQACSFVVALPLMLARRAAVRRVGRGGRAVPRGARRGRAALSAQPAPHRRVRPRRPSRAVALPTAAGVVVWLVELGSGAGRSRRSVLRGGAARAFRGRRDRRARLLAARQPQAPPVGRDQKEAT